MAAGLKLWAHRSGASLLLEESTDPLSPESPSPLAGLSPSPLAGEGRGGGFEIVLGPYGSDSVRAIATAFPDRIVWNHGAAADDVQRLPNVISIPSPSSQYLVALARAVARLRPGGNVAVVIAKGRFAEYAWNGLVAAAAGIDLELAGRVSFDGGPATRHDAILAIGPVHQELELFRRLVNVSPRPLLGGVSPGLAAFPEALGANPEGLLAPVQWHASAAASPELGPTSSEVLDDARSLALDPIDYVAAQAYAAALIADYCRKQDAIHPETAARKLRTSTFFGDFELDSMTGEQRGHEMTVIQWRNGRQELLR